MEARVRSMEASGLNGLKKKSLEWDLNDWKWDGELFLASPVNTAPSDCRNKQLSPILTAGGLSNNSSSCSEDTDLEIIGKGKGTIEKRRRTEAVGGAEHCDEVGSLTLKLGGGPYPLVEADLINLEGKNGKRSKLQGNNSSRFICQVEGCGADLTDSKDYHRRHKVCEMHAKASSAVVASVVQRFCQQCSRFHLLQEFDEGKRSCRRRLAGHNRRRRKTHPEASVSGSSLTDDQASSYLLISLLRILTNLHTDNSDKSKDQDLLSHLLRNLASLAGSLDSGNLSHLLQATQQSQNVGNNVATSSEAANPSFSNGVAMQESSRLLTGSSHVAGIDTTQCPTLELNGRAVSTAVATIQAPANWNVIEPSLGQTVPAAGSQRSVTLVARQDAMSDKATKVALCSLQHMLPTGSQTEKVRLKAFDLNSTFDDTQDCIDEYEQSAIPSTLLTGSPNCPSGILPDSHHSSPPQTSGNSESASGQSLSSSSGDGQSRTDRIVFKLFGKHPMDFPILLRAQILNWLSHVPTDMESYIRPGCIILTIYLRLAESAWGELCRELSLSLNKLLHSSGDDFWISGWVYLRVQHQIAFLYNGQVVLDTPLVARSPNYFDILCVTPIAVPASAKVNFKVKGLGISRSAVRILCAFEGKYLVQESTQSFVEETNNGGESRGSQYLCFSCSLPNASGRGFIEVEDQFLSSIFFPFIVAEKDICSEICMLEKAIEIDSRGGCIQKQMNARNQAIEFLHEIGWLLRGSQLRLRSERADCCPSSFPKARFLWLMSFAMDQEWCAVVRKLLDLLVQGNVDLGSGSPGDLLLSSDFLHTAVRKNCRSLVELLLRYKPPTTPLKDTNVDKPLFRPDLLGPSNITPLHIAAASIGAESVLDALTDDPGQLGIEAWKSARDSNGFTPGDYARSRGHQSYLQLVQKKIKGKTQKQHVLDIPDCSFAIDSTPSQSDAMCSDKLTSFQIDKRLNQGSRSYCKLCDRRLTSQSFANRSLLYRPSMLSMVCIATVCVCVGLLLKSPPFVLYISHPFRWESLSYGSI